MAPPEAGPVAPDPRLQRIAWHRSEAVRLQAEMWREQDQQHVMNTALHMLQSKARPPFVPAGPSPVRPPSLVSGDSGPAPPPPPPRPRGNLEAAPSLGAVKQEPTVDAVHWRGTPPPFPAVVHGEKNDAIAQCHGCDFHGNCVETKQSEGFYCLWCWHDFIELKYARPAPPDAAPGCQLPVTTVAAADARPERFGATEAAADAQASQAKAAANLKTKMPSFGIAVAAKFGPPGWKKAKVPGDSGFDCLKDGAKDTGAAVPKPAEPSKKVHKGSVKETQQQKKNKKKKKKSTSSSSSSQSLSSLTFPSPSKPAPAVTATPVTAATTMPATALAEECKNPWCHERVSDKPFVHPYCCGMCSQFHQDKVTLDALYAGNQDVSRFSKGRRQKLNALHISHGGGCSCW